jgi:hypothetical protein
MPLSAAENGIFAEVYCFKLRNARTNNELEPFQYQTGSHSEFTICLTAGRISGGLAAVDPLLKRGSF